MKSASSTESPFRISKKYKKDPSLIPYSPSVIATGSGFTAVYSHADFSPSTSAYKGLFAQKVSSKGILEGEQFQVSDYTASRRDHYVYTNQIDSKYDAAKLSDTTWMGVWSGYTEQSETSFPIVYGQVMDNNGTKIGEEFPISNNFLHAGDSPAAIALPEGGCAVVYRVLSNGNNYDILEGQLYHTNGTQRGKSFQLPYDYLENRYYSFAALPEKIVVTTEVYDQKNHKDDLRQQYISTKEPTIGKLVGESLITNTLNTYVISSDMAVFPNGVVNTVWSQVGDSSGIFAERSDSDQHTKLSSSATAELSTTMLADEMLVAWANYNKQLVVQRFDQKNQPDSTIFNVGTSKDCPGKARFSPVLSTNGRTTMLAWEEWSGVDRWVCGQILPELESLPSNNSPAETITTIVGVGAALLVTLAAGRGLYKRLAGTGYTATQTTESDLEMHLITSEPNPVVTAGAINKGKIVNISSQRKVE